MSANEQGIIAVTGRAHCQRQVAFLGVRIIFRHVICKANIFQPTQPPQFASYANWKKRTQKMDHP